MSDLNRSARAMTVLTIVSRLTGFARVAVFAAVFGKSFLANTYNSANYVPNILFELFAAGALQAVLVPTMVRLMPSGADAERTSAGHDEAERVAGTVLGLLCGLLAVIGVIAVAFGARLMALLVRDVPDAGIRAAEIELGALFLWFFMPQLVFYGANVVATAVLNARNKFALPVFAPTLNNLVVIGAYLWFGAVHEGPLTLELSDAETWIVAGGTTAGVVLFCLLPVLAVRRDGFDLRPRFEVSHPALRSLLVDGAWAGAFLALTQVNTLVVLIVANRESGGTTVYSFALILFTLPHALFSVPIMTTRFPELSRSAHLGDWPAFRLTMSEAVRAIAFMALGASAISLAVAGPGATLITYGKGVELASQIGDATMAFAPGIVGFGLLLFFTRAMYATGDARTPALVNLGVVAITSTLMLTVVPTFDGSDLITGLGGAFAFGNLLGAAALGWLANRHLLREGQAPMGVSASFARSVAAAAGAAAVGYGVARGIGWTGRPTAALSLVAATAVAATVYLVGQWLIGGPTPKVAISTLGAGERERR